MRRKTVIWLLVCCLLAASGQALASRETAADGVVEAEALRRYEYISSIAPAISVSGSTASYTLTVAGAASVTSFSATLQIQKLGSNGAYSNYGTSWSASSSANTLRTSGTKAVASGGTYRLKATVTAYFSGGNSTETAYS